eukprot:6015511-Amphidinium_carterae.1
MYASVQQQSLLQEAQGRTALVTPLPPELTWMLEWQSHTKTSAVQKLFQVRSSYGMLLAQGDLTCLLLGDTVNPLNVLSRNTGGVMQASLLKLSGCSSAASRFKLPIRASTTDRAPANFNAEDLTNAARGPNWAKLHCLCDVHRIARAHTKCLEELLGGDVAGLIRTALSLQPGSMMPLFREALA